MLSAKLKEAAGNGIASTLYVDDVFSTYLYTGNGSTQTITNGIDLAGQGGLVWVKIRSGFNSPLSHALFDTSRGVLKRLASNLTDAQASVASSLTAFNSTGFTVDSSVTVNGGGAGDSYVSWTFRKSAKFFDVVTYTGDGVAGRSIAHSLGVAPGMIIVKSTSYPLGWPVYHISNGAGAEQYLDMTNAVSYGGKFPSAPTSSSFYISENDYVNKLGETYVAYLFAHDTSSTGIIKCGGTALNASGFATVNLGWEPQYVMIKSAQYYGSWAIYDTMRGAVALKSSDLYSAFSAQKLLADSSAAESTAIDYTIAPNSTGFTLSATGYSGAAYDDFIYLAIRRPNKPPTSGTQVYYPVARSGTGATGSSTSFGQVTDLVFTKQRGSTQTWAWTDRLRGATKELTSAATTVETAYANDLTGFDTMTGFYFGSGASGQMNTSGSNYDDHLFRRAPGFMDVVCYTGTGSATTQAHELTVVPELIIVKERSAANDWWVYNATVGNTKYSVLNSTAIPVTSSTAWNNTTPTSSVFSIGTGANVNASTQTYVAYLFATLAGISKVGSYTGNGTTQTINCGFTGGARFVLIKRTDSTGDWYVFDTARGMTTLTDPYLFLNSTAAEVATLGAVTSVTTGFAVNAAIVAAINTNAASYIYLSIA